MISAGRRDKWVLLTKPGGSMPDGEGGYTEGYLPLTPPHVYARINPATQADLERAAPGTIIATATHTIEIDYHPQVTVETRIEYADPDTGTRTFSVKSVREPEEARRELVIVAEELLSP